MIWGHVGMRTLLRRPQGWLHRPLPTPGHPLATLGRWSLSYYMLHQPVLLGILLAWRSLLGP
jgi:peptidoglycan/LPS O-acetylase OafA/YrhL